MSKKVIAIFEDDHVNRFIYERIFQGRNDVELHIFDSPDKGVALAEEIRFDLVFIEIHFWGNFGGLGILNRLRETPAQSVTFIAMTSLLQKGDVERILRSGFHLYIENPVIFSEMDLLSLTM
jgi:CheY-like chemotaxis protein